MSIPSNKTDSAPRWWPAASWLLVLAWMAVIFVFSSQANLPTAPKPLLDLIAKKLAHVGEYTVLLILCYNAVSRTGSGRHPVASLVVAVAIALGYALSDEFHQSLTPNRRPSLVDVGIDSIGIAIGCVAVRLYGRWRAVRSGV